MSRFAIAYLSASDQLEESSLPSGTEVIATIVDQAGDQLGQTLQRIAAGDADTLLVPRLSAAVGSLGELVRLLDWLAAADATLLATDVGLDTASSSWRPALALLREIDRWGREPGDSRRPRGRPGLSAAAPDLAERIGEMRERGLSLQAIADVLNADGVPTPRGGAQWRPSSVQSALGYQRPRPPVPGAPPPPGRHGRGRGGPLAPGRGGPLAPGRGGPLAPGRDATPPPGGQAPAPPPPARERPPKAPPTPGKDTPPPPRPPKPPPPKRGRP